MDTVGVQREVALHAIRRRLQDHPRRVTCRVFGSKGKEVTFLFSMAGLNGEVWSVTMKSLCGKGKASGATIVAPPSLIAPLEIEALDQGGREGVAVSLPSERPVRS